ncbi:hypothetical protein RsoM2USA_447 [Ralstonia phage RsoM2USA]|nr:hypothetical protein RsoM2USA_447 [Ralstonia phage RsoM2USA]
MTSIKHVDYVDVNDDGVKEEIAVVKRWEDGSIAYIEVQGLDYIDKGRLKSIITGPHSDKYELFELMSQTTLRNGMNALDYFHEHLIKIKRAPGSIDRRVERRGLMDAQYTERGVMSQDQFNQQQFGVGNGSNGIPF